MAEYDYQSGYGGRNFLRFQPGQRYNERFTGSGYQDDRFNQLNRHGSGFEEVARLQQFKRKDRSLGYLEMILARQEGLEGMVNQFKNPFTQQISSSLDSATARVQGMRGQMDDIGDDLRTSSLARTQGAQVAALSAARQTSGRGGTAFGGGGSVQTRAAREAATAQSAGLAQAMVQGRQMKSQFDLQQAGMETSLAKMMMDARSKQSALTEADIGRRVGVQQSFQEMLTSMGGIGGSKSNAEARQRGTNLGILGNWG